MITLTSVNDKVILIKSQINELPIFKQKYTLQSKKSGNLTKHARLIPISLYFNQFSDFELSKFDNIFIAPSNVTSFNLIFVSGVAKVLLEDTIKIHFEYERKNFSLLIKQNSNFLIRRTKYQIKKYQIKKIEDFKSVLKAVSG